MNKSYAKFAASQVDRFNSIASRAAELEASLSPSEILRDKSDSKNSKDRPHLIQAVSQWLKQCPVFSREKAKEQR